MATPKLREIATGLRFPEGPVALADGSVLVVEIAAARLTRVGARWQQDNSRRSTRGGPNGAAIGPDGKAYVCNNGGFNWHELPGRRARPGWPGRRLFRRAHRARGPRDRQDRDPLHRVRRLSAQRPQRHRVRCARRLLLHRSRQDPAARDGPRRRLLRQGRRQQHQAHRLSLHHAQRLRPLARW